MLEIHTLRATNVKKHELVDFTLTVIASYQARLASTVHVEKEREIVEAQVFLEVSVIHLVNETLESAY